MLDAQEWTKSLRDDEELQAVGAESPGCAQTSLRMQDVGLPLGGRLTNRFFEK